MSNLANYSPFNRSYQFIHLQNAAYHLRNKQNIKPKVNTNIRHQSQTYLHPTPNPTHNNYNHNHNYNLSHNYNYIQNYNQNYNHIQPPSHSQGYNPQCSSSRSGSSKHRYGSARSRSKSHYQPTVSLKQPHRVIHKNQVFQRAKSARISHQNMKLVRKIIKTDCQILKNSAAEDHFRLHQKYRSLRRRYQENGERFTTPIINLQQLNPVLLHYKHSRISSARSARQEPQTMLGNLPLDWLE